MPTTLYDLLGVRQSATIVEIAEATQRFVAESITDIKANGASHDFEADSSRARAAVLLLNADHRAAYDESLEILSRPELPSAAVTLGGNDAAVTFDNGFDGFNALVTDAMESIAREVERTGFVDVVCARELNAVIDKIEALALIGGNLPVGSLAGMVAGLVVIARAAGWEHWYDSDFDLEENEARRLLAQGEPPN
ncbi:hypothetical protein Back2_18210 [Nocardioides baekrokdamisoli]|uniref:J domain-containing protein n=1 Tax=Nocardioides baekrokdamisoli TaxID=1804624 RepID=A0A3G9J256_9ACTN|nr:hypothetical protein [Nocardioides baekrokdamisoli]BBH17534.1 hypothetical protein Back2_18210 [Nocardioides baekrokdamisoli]